MKILVATSELEPFASSGELSKNISNFVTCVGKKEKVECVMPLYSMIDENIYSLKPTGRGFQVPVADRLENAEIWEGTHPDSGVKVWFVASRYFERDGLYGNVTGDYPDNSERFVFFCRAVLEIASEISHPDIIHCNDWQTALIPLYLNEVYKKSGKMENVTSSLFIHDVRFQGRFWLYDLYILNLGWEVFSPDKLEFYNDINFLKGGIVYSDAIMVINSEYLKKICSGINGCGMEGVLEKYKEKIFPVCECDGTSLLCEDGSDGPTEKIIEVLEKICLQKA